MPNIAIIHDWLTGMRGGERCLEVFCETFPDAHLYTLIHLKGAVSPVIERMRISPSGFQSLPWVKKKYRYYLPVMPWFVERIDLSQYDLVLSSSHCVAKGAVTGEKTKHICYCYSPMRYIWDQRDSYFGQGGMGTFERLAMFACAGYLKKWDRKTAQNVDRFIAISKHVSERIRKCYERESDIIYPPVNTSFYLPDKTGTKDYFLMVTAFAPYKKVNMAVEAFNRLKLPLKIIGTGQMERQLKKIAGPHVEFLGWRSDEEVRAAYAGCRAFIFPGEEDFGITPLEAQSCGRPVIAFGKGGALETVIPVNPHGSSIEPQSATGLFFYKQESESLEEAVLAFQKIEKDFNPDIIRKNAMKFDRDIFKKRIKNYIEDILS